MHRDSIPYDLEAKTLVIGDSGVGKTSLLLQFCDKHFNTEVPVTVGKLHHFSFFFNIFSCRLLFKDR